MSTRSTITFAPPDRRVRVCPINGVAAPCRPSRLWVAWPWEPFLTIGGSVALLAMLALLTVPLTTQAAVVVGLLGAAGTVAAALGVTMSRVRRRWEVRAFRHASMTLLSQRSR